MRRTDKPPEPERWAEELARALGELADPLRPRDRRERIARLLDAITEHYRSIGQPEPAWLARIRELGRPQAPRDGTE